MNEPRNDDEYIKRLITERDTARAEVAKLEEVGIELDTLFRNHIAMAKDELGKLTAERDAAFVRGLERAIEICVLYRDRGLIQDEIDKASK